MSTEPGQPGDNPPVPFILPGPVTDRETVQGWRHWRLSRHAFVPAPRLSLTDYRRLSPRKRHLHDLHRCRRSRNSRAVGV